MQVHIRELESQHGQLLEQIIHKQEEVSGLQGALWISQTRTGILEAQMEDLERRREDAFSTLFRLRPQGKNVLRLRSGKTMTC
jgi:hypothetical protein